MLKVIEESCIGCKLCEKACPFGAIVVESDTKKAKVLENCTLCGSCVNACKYGALVIERKAVSEEDLMKYKGVFIWGEWEKRGDQSKQIKNVVFELLGKGRDLAEKLNEELAVVLIGDKIEHLAEELFYYGADRVYICENELLDHYTTDGFTTAMSAVITAKKPSIVLYGATPNGRDFAPRVAARLVLGLTADCTGLDINEKGQLMQTRPAFGGNIMATILSPYTRPQMSTVRPNVFTKPKKDENRKGKIEKFEVKIQKQSIRTKVLEDVELEEAEENIEEAPILVSIGRGIGSKENLSLAKDLTSSIGGTLSGSRALVDLGWLPQPKQVGQSGKTVAPSLYIALGISGAIQHLVGMQTSDTIISVNSDPEAPIFKTSDLGIVGDIFEIVPELIKIIEKNNKKY